MQENNDENNLNSLTKDERVSRLNLFFFIKHRDPLKCLLKPEMNFGYTENMIFHRALIKLIDESAEFKKLFDNTIEFLKNTNHELINILKEFTQGYQLKAEGTPIHIIIMLEKFKNEDIGIRIEKIHKEVTDRLRKDIKQNRLYTRTYMVYSSDSYLFREVDVQNQHLDFQPQPQPEPEPINNSEGIETGRVSLLKRLFSKQ